MKLTKNRKIGNLGEDIGVIYLQNKNFNIIERNWENLPYGEIDIIAEKQGVIFFFEIKSTTSLKTSKYSPKDHLTKDKIYNLNKSVKKYLQIKNWIYKEIKVSALIIYLNLEEKKARVGIINNL